MAKSNDDPAVARRAKLYEQKLAMIVGEGGSDERTAERLAIMLPKAAKVGAKIPPQVDVFLDARSLKAQPEMPVAESDDSDAEAPDAPQE